MSKTTLCAQNLTSRFTGVSYWTVPSPLATQHVNRAGTDPVGPTAQIMRIMRMLIFIIFSMSLAVSARTSSQNVTLSGTKMPLEKVFSSIKKQTGYLVFANRDLLAPSTAVSFSVTNMPLMEFLDQLLIDQPLSYKIEDKTIVLYEKVLPSKLRYVDQLVPLAVISGRIRGQDGSPLAGITFSRNNAAIGISDSEGRFSFSANEGDIITVSAVGYLGLKFRVVTGTNQTGLRAVLVSSDKPAGGDETQTEKVSASSLQNTNNGLLIVLIPSIATLENIEVAVSTGYQTIAKERATGSFGVISKEQLEKPTTNIASRLIGTTAGLQANLDVDGNPTFRLRGQTTLIPEDAVQPLAQQPLVVLDGFPIQGDFSTINPNDVESVTILKDAAAASIWGARAANGVIVVVSKSGKTGTPLKVEFSAFTKMGKKFDLDYVNPLATSAETVEYEKASFNKWSAQTNSNSLSNDYYKIWSLGTTALSEHALGFLTLTERDAILEQLKTQSNKQQIADHLLANPTTQQYALNLSGSSSRMTNNLSLLFENNQTNFKESYQERYMLNYRSTSQLFKWLALNIGGMVQYNKNTNNGANNQSRAQPTSHAEVYNGTATALGTIAGLSPYELLVNPDGTLTNIHQYPWPLLERFVPMNLFPYADWTYNPIREINSRSITSTQLNTRLQAGLTFKLLRGLTFDTRVQYELFNTFNRALHNEDSYLVRNLLNTSTTWIRKTATAPDTLRLNVPRGSILAQSRSKGESYNIRNQLSFNRELGNDHLISAIVGTETNNLITETFVHPTTYGFNNNTLTTGLFPNGPGGAFKQIPNWLGANQTFSYTNTFTYRTERFFSYYGNLAYTYKDKYTVSGSFRTDAANIISDDPKYRYDPFWSVGGSWQIYKEDFFANIATVNFLSIRMTYGYNGNVDRTTAFQPLINLAPTPNIYTNEQTSTISSFGNPTLRWEKTGTWNLGIDYRILNNRLFGKIDFYNKSGKDLIATLSIPAVNGTTSQKLNNAAMTNRGIEVEIGTIVPIANQDISWQGNLNFSYNKNKITKLFVATYSSSSLASGGSAAYVEGVDANSIWRFEYAGIQNNQPMIKGPKGTLYDFGAFAPGDGREYMLNMGTSVAPYTLGFMNSFKVYDFNLSFILTGKFGHVFQRESFNYPPTWTSRVLPNKKITEVINGDPSKIVPLPLNDIEPRYYFWDRFHQSLHYLIENASHVRMQEVSIVYNLNNKLLPNLKFSSVRLFAQGNDLFTVYANNAKEDPEYPLGTMKPRPKLTLGIKCEF